MQRNDTTLTIAAGPDLTQVLAQLPALSGDQGDVTLVHSGFTTPDLETVVRWATAGEPHRLDADSLALNPFDRTQRVAVDVDAVAPRLREVRLPAAIVEANTVMAAIDARKDRTPRPDLILGLWANLVPGKQRIAAKITGARDGLTAEFLLARPPDQIIILDNLVEEESLVCIKGTDPIASEVLALAIRESRRSTPSGSPGPWEDWLVQRATELDLGCAGPTSISIDLRIDDRIPIGQQTRIREIIQFAVGRAGVDRVLDR